MLPSLLTFPARVPRAALLVVLLSLTGCWWDDDDRRPVHGGPDTGTPVDPAPDADLAVVVPAPDYWPTAGWAEAAADQHGFVVDAFAALAEEAAAEMPFYTSLLVVKNGYLVHESYQDEAAPPEGEETPEQRFIRLQDERRHVWSVSKSVNALTAALALSRGDIASLDVRVADHFDATETGITGMDDARLDMTYRHVLQMRSGLAWNEDAWLLSFTRDPLFTAFGKPACGAAPDRLFCSILQQQLAYAPGSTWNYSTYDSYLAAAFFRRLTGLSLHDYAATHLFSVLGMGEDATTWQTLAPLAGTTFGGGLLNIRSRDLARLGLLVLHNGQWEGSEVIAPGHMQAMLATQGAGLEAAFGDDDVPLDDAEPAFVGYGQQWWRRSGSLSEGLPVILARGLHGQRLYVVRAHNLVVVLTSNSNSADAADRAARYAAIDQFVQQRILGRLAPATP